MLIDMGTHMFSNNSGVVQIFQVTSTAGKLWSIPTMSNADSVNDTVLQVAIPGLEDRARQFPPLNTTQSISPGYFDAPGALNCSLQAFDRLSLDNNNLLTMTLVFCSIDHFAEMQVRQKCICSST